MSKSAHGSALPRTNAMRMLDAARIPYEVLTYEVDENDLSGVHIAEQLSYPPEMIFKTLVAHGDRTGYLVFCIPVALEIDLRTAASLTGYIRGGCSPIGMKKKFPTFFDASALSLDKIAVSAGMRGAQLLLDRAALMHFVDGKALAVTGQTPT